MTATHPPTGPGRGTQRADGVARFETAGGARIYRLPLEAFPDFWAYAYLILVGDAQVLIDTGSGFGDSPAALLNGLSQVSELDGTTVDPHTLTEILITHGHIDHFGGLLDLAPRTPARIGVHELDLRTLTNFEERLTLVARRLSTYLVESGVSPADREQLLNMYLLQKSLCRSVRVDFTYAAAGMRVGPLELLHVPGHCAGHVVIRLHDVLFSGDHVLEGISPHQAPERLTLSTGLEHYFDSLEALRRWAGDVRLTLGGHNDPVHDLNARIAAIRALHADRLRTVLASLEEPHTIADVAGLLFGRVDGYHHLLAIEEAGAHVEYLYRRGRLEIANLDELGERAEAMAIRYRRVREVPAAGVALAEPPN